jgi:large subunit ribosomal protein L3
MKLLGYKMGMTRVFMEDGKVIPVTALEVTPCVVTQVKSIDKDGYTAVQIGSGTKKHPNKPLEGHVKAAAAAAPQHLREFRTEDTSEFTVGQTIDLSALTAGALLSITGTSKGKGFAGTIKRHNFHRGPETHGSDHHRRPGSNGSMFPQHVLKGKKQPGHLGNEQVTVRKVKVVDILHAENIVLVTGPVPGVRGALVELNLM